MRMRMKAISNRPSWMRSMKPFEADRAMCSSFFLASVKFARRQRRCASMPSADPGQGRATTEAEILPLFARLSHAEQERVFRPGGSSLRRIVLATNVAETSLTVPGIRYVIDTGLARPQPLQLSQQGGTVAGEKISRASANQRAGRCGRVMSGICIRLCPEEDYQARPEFTDPEILRSSLAAVILRMKSLKIGAVENFLLLDPPLPRMVADGYQLLSELGAVDEANALTGIGWRSEVSHRPEDCADDIGGEGRELPERSAYHRFRLERSRPARAPVRTAGSGRPGSPAFSG